MHAENVLEFEALRAVLARYLRSPLGRAELAAVAPVSDRTAIETALADAAEAVEYLRAASQPQPASRGAAIRLRFDLSVDPAPAVARLRIEGSIRRECRRRSPAASRRSPASRSRSAARLTRRLIPARSSSALPGQPTGHPRSSRSRSRTVRATSSGRPEASPSSARSTTGQ